MTLATSLLISAALFGSSPSPAHQVETRGGLVVAASDHQTSPAAPGGTEAPVVLADVTVPAGSAGSCRGDWVDHWD